jgi:DNA-directed RNA polymerase alpha subunit
MIADLRDSGPKPVEFGIAKADVLKYSLYICSAQTDIQFKMQIKINSGVGVQTFRHTHYTVDGIKILNAKIT